jgi:hypothetical protein
MKYEDFVINSFQDNKRKNILTFKANVTLTFELVNLELLGFIN